MIKLLAIILPLQLFAIKTYAATAKVIMLKGEATKLLPHKMHPEPVKKGEVLPKDTSIVTTKGSFVKVQFEATKTTMVIGPNSKINIVSSDKKSGTVVSHLIGALRTKVSQKTKKEKVFIRTKSASMGVRGTELLTVVNQENKATSVVTFEGNVGVVKVNKTDRPVTSVEELSEKFEKEEAVTEVRKGRAVSAYEEVKEVTPPKKVQPKQLVALKENEDLVADKKEPAKEVELTPEQEKELYAPDTEEEKKNPQSMGVVDLNSAIFVPTDEKGEIIGEVDANGNYKPKEGLKLDPLVGFVPADPTNAKTVAMAEQINQKLEFKPKEEHIEAYKKEVARKIEDVDLSNDFYLGVGAAVAMYETEVFDDLNYNSAKYTSNPAIRILTGYHMRLNRQFKLLIDVELQGMTYNKGDDFPENPDYGDDPDPEDRARGHINVGIASKVNDRMSFNTFITLRSDLYFTGYYLANENKVIPITKSLDSEGLTLELDYLISMNAKSDYYLLPRVTFVNAASFDELQYLDFMEIGLKLQRKVMNSSSYMQVDFRKSSVMDGSLSNQISQTNISFDWIYVF